MKHVDMRSLTAEAQEERRRQVIGLRQAGQTYTAIAAQVGLTPTGVFDICKRFAERGPAGLKSKARGPAPGHGSLLTAEQEAAVQALIRQQMPDELGLPFALWSRAAVQALVRQCFGVTVAVRTMGSYLARWGYTPQKPLRRAYEQDPAAVRRWLRREYPAIAARAKAEKGVIFWGDESGLRSDDVRGRSYAPRGETPVVPPNHRRANVGLVSAVTNRGELRRVGGDVAIPTPHRPGRADFPHPVPHGRASLAIMWRLVDRLSAGVLWTGLSGSVSPPMFPATGSLTVTPPFPPSGPSEPGSPT